jgi:hypothetical protein
MRRRATRSSLLRTVILALVLAAVASCGASAPGANPAPTPRAAAPAGSPPPASPTPMSPRPSATADATSCDAGGWRSAPVSVSRLVAVPVMPVITAVRTASGSGGCHLQPARRLRPYRRGSVHSIPRALVCNHHHSMVTRCVPDSWLTGRGPPAGPGRDPARPSHGLQPGQWQRPFQLTGGGSSGRGHRRAGAAGNGAAPAGDPAELVASSATARSELGWAPTKPGLHNIVADAWAFIRNREA